MAHDIFLTYSVKLDVTASAANEIYWFSNEMYKCFVACGVIQYVTVYEAVKKNAKVCTTDTKIHTKENAQTHTHTHVKWTIKTETWGNKRKRRYLSSIRCQEMKSSTATVFLCRQEFIREFTSKHSTTNMRRFVTLTVQTLMLLRVRSLEGVSCESSSKKINSNCRWTWFKKNSSHILYVKSGPCFCLNSFRR